MRKIIIQKNKFWCAPTATTQEDNFGGIKNRWDLFSDEKGEIRVGKLVEYFSGDTNFAVFHEPHIRYDFQNTVVSFPLSPTEKIKVRIERCLYPSGYKPYFLVCHKHQVDGQYSEFPTLFQLKEHFKITAPLKKLAEKGWALNSKGTKEEWLEYETKISASFAK